jgi:hypothetical protein
MGLFARVQTPRYVADNVGVSVERSSFLPLLRLSGEKEARALVLNPCGQLVAVFERDKLLEREDRRKCTWSAPPETVDLVNGTEAN